MTKIVYIENCVNFLHYCEILMFEALMSTENKPINRRLSEGGYMVEGIFFRVNYHSIYNV